jgi:hypothetical protein
LGNITDRIANIPKVLKERAKAWNDSHRNWIILFQMRASKDNTRHWASSVPRNVRSRQQRFLTK